LKDPSAYVPQHTTVATPPADLQDFFMAEVSSTHHVNTSVGWFVGDETSNTVQRDVETYLMISGYTKTGESDRVKNSGAEASVSSYWIRAYWQKGKNKIVMFDSISLDPKETDGRVLFLEGLKSPWEGYAITSFTFH
jgi:hypothetical protein